MVHNKVTFTDKIDDPALALLIAQNGSDSFMLAADINQVKAVANNTVDNVKTLEDEVANKSNSWLDYLSTVKFPTWNAIVTYIVDLFSVNKVIEIGVDTPLENLHSGKLIVVTANCTITVPNGLRSGFNVSFVTLPGVTVSFTLGSFVEFINNVGFSMTGGKSCTLQGRTALNKILIFGAL